MGVKGTGTMTMATTSRGAVFLAALALSLAACSTKIEDMQRGEITVRSGEVIQTCLDPRLEPGVRSYVDIAALTDLSKASFRELGQPYDEWREMTDDPARRHLPEPVAVSFADSQKYHSMQSSMVRDCWDDGDPRENGLQRYRLALIEGGGQFAHYNVYFSGERAVYIEGYKLGD